MDLFARTRCIDYARARDDMLKRTDHEHGRWWACDSSVKQLAQLNSIQHILRCCSPYEDIPPANIKLPLLPRQSSDGYEHPDPLSWNLIPAVYDAKALEVPATLLLQAASMQVSDIAAEGLAAAVKIGPEQ
jgi:hypothetical protein